MVRHGTENVVIADRLQRWTKGLLTTRDPAACRTVSRSTCSRCSWCRNGHQGWDCGTEYLNEAYAQGVSDARKALATSLTSPTAGSTRASRRPTGCPSRPAPLDRADSAARRCRIASLRLLVLASPRAALQRRNGHGLSRAHRRAVVGRAVAAAPLSRPARGGWRRRPWLAGLCMVLLAGVLTLRRHRGA